MLVTFVLFGHWMEMRSRRGTNDALRALFDLVPPQATVIRDGEELTIPSSVVRLDDTVLLRPGDKVPVDGEVVEGETSIDEALVTGESVPVTKRPGDEVLAGSINRSGSVRFRATAVGSDTTLAQIVDLVQQAQNSKAPGQRLADRAAEYLECVFAEVLPADKTHYVEQLQREGKRVAMVGDGVNDAPALAQADIGIAIGAGTDVAIETAKVVLMKSDPLGVTRAVVLSKATVRKMKQNLVWATVYNVLAIPVAAGVLFPSYGIMLRPEWSALLMSVSSIIVAVNAVLLKGVEDDLDEPRSAGLSPEPAPTT